MSARSTAISSALPAAVEALFPGDRNSSRVDLREAAGFRFEDCLPCRPPIEHPDQSYVVGKYFHAGLGVLVDYESWLERTFLLECDFHGIAAAVLSQPMKLHWSTSGRGRSHIPDFFIRRDDGSVLLVDVRRRAQVKGKAAEDFERTRSMCRSFGWDYRVFNELSDVHRDNLEWLSGYRRHSETVDARLDEVLAAAGDGCPLHVLLDATDGDVSARAAVFRLLWLQRLTIDLQRPLTLTSEVTPS